MSSEANFLFALQFSNLFLRRLSDCQMSFEGHLFSGVSLELRDHLLDSQSLVISDDSILFQLFRLIRITLYDVCIVNF